MMESEGPDPAVYKAFQKDTLQEVLLTYFRILKSPDNAKLIHVVLEGLAKFGHLLNSRIIIDLLQILKEIMLKNELSMESTLQCNSHITLLPTLRTDASSFSTSRPTHHLLPAPRAAAVRGICSSHLALLAYI